jgi:hypothetical protein
MFGRRSEHVPFRTQNGDTEKRKITTPITIAPGGGCLIKSEQWARLFRDYL